MDGERWNNECRSGRMLLVYPLDLHRPTAGSDPKKLVQIVMMMRPDPPIIDHASRMNGLDMKTIRKPLVKTFAVEGEGGNQIGRRFLFHVRFVQETARNFHIQEALAR